MSCLLEHFKFPSRIWKCDIYKYLKAKHFIKIENLEYLYPFEKNNFEEISDLVLFKKIFLGEKSEYSSNILSKKDLQKITIMLSYYFAENQLDFKIFIEAIINTTLGPNINKSFYIL